MVNPVSGSSSSGTITSQYSSLMRVNGMASGMDIDSMVSSMMKAASVPLDKMKQNQQLLLWKTDDYRSMYTSLDDLDQTIFTGIGRQSTFNAKTATSSDDSKVTATAVNATYNISTTISVTQLAKAASWGGNGVNTGFTQGARTLLFDVYKDGTKTNTDPIKIDIGATDDINAVADKINSSNLGVTAMVQNILDSSTNTYKQTLVFTNNKTGSGYSIQTNDSTGTTNTFMKSLGFKFDSSNSNLLVASTSGQNAQVTINGFQTEQESNSFTINGINYNIKGTTTIGNVDTPVNISTATDVDSIYSSIKTFVDKYNSVIKTVNDKVSEKRNYSYPPLTDDQKKSMTDSQITEWNDQAKSGMLAHDSILSNGLDKMRQNLYTPVTGTHVTDGFSQLSQIGITTSSDYTDNGKLVIDEQTLRQKIQENPQAIYQMFNGGVRSSDTSGTYSYGSEGLAKRLRDSISATNTQIINEAGKASYLNNQFAIGKELIDLGKQITDFQSRLSDLETRYYNQFSAMEQAMQNANNQSTYVSQMFSK
jgi:flagellar hook-associated protein 2